MRTFIVHFLAKRTLEAHTDEFPKEVSLSIMVLNCSPSMSLSWSDVEGIIINVMSSGGVNHRLDPQTAVDKLKERVQAITVNLKTRKGDVVKTFQAIVNGEENNGFAVGLHAEILTMAGLEDCRKTLLRNSNKEFGTLREVWRLYSHSSRLDSCVNRILLRIWMKFRCRGFAVLSAWNISKS